MGVCHLIIASVKYEGKLHEVSSHNDRDQFLYCHEGGAILLITQNFDPA